MLPRDKGGVVDPELRVYVLEMSEWLTLLSCPSNFVAT
jgi:hypothetical protein